jgi:peptide/nickel transport system ATP-binding protein
MAELLAVRGLSVEFATDRGPAQVLDGINLDVAPGEVVGLVGESGCGKTTLARAILGILPSGAARVRGGEVRFKGSDLLREDPRALNDRVRGRAITFIPQDPFTSLSPVFPVGTQIMDLMKWKSPRAETGDRPAALFGRYPRRRWRADRDAVLETLRAVQMPEPARALRRLPHEFSGGQRQRLMIAMALLPRPELIIADEPTTNLDVTIQAQYLNMLKDLQRRTGVALLFITHNLGIVAKMCDRVAVMYAGRIVEQGSVREIFKNPRHPYSQALLSSIPKIGSRDPLYAIPGSPPDLANLPPGCAFSPRCAQAFERCTAEEPHDVPLGPGHFAKCFLLEGQSPGVATPPPTNGAAQAPVVAGEPSIPSQ